jgi:hypothetical protein
MTRDTPPRRAAGAIIALTVIGGAVIGVIEGQPSIGLLAGLGVGVAVALLMWWRDRG